MGQNQTLSFCADPFWDANLTWYTDDPDFTGCFQQTVIVYLPAALLLAFAPLHVHFVRTSRDKMIPWTLVMVAKVALNSLLVATALVDLGLVVTKDIKTDGPWQPVDYVAAAVELVSMSSAMVILLSCIKPGLVSSGLLFYFWTLTAICDGIRFRSAVVLPGGINQPLSDRVLTILRYPFIVAMFFLNCWADAKPQYIDTSGRIENAK